MSGNQEEPLSIEESRELMGRIAHLQQEKATLEERVYFFCLVFGTLNRHFLIKFKGKLSH